jgi:ribulose-phosphate 3-epimerase
MYVIAPSILSADMGNLREDINKIVEGGAKYIHVDVMDGMFVPNISFGFPVLKAVREMTDAVLDVHLMIADPDRYIEEFAQAGADIICVHAEACTHLHRTIQHIKQLGKKAAVALNPGTPLSVLDYVLEDLDMVLVMSVNPGFGGQKFISSALRKIKDLRKMAEERGLTDLDIEVDGGVCLENLTEVKEAGANIFVAGSAVFKGDCKKNTEAFLKLMQK